MIEIHHLNPEDEKEYRRFLLKNPRNLIYASPEFRDFLSAAVPGESYYLIAWRDGRIVGALPYFRAEHDTFGAVINSLPWYGSHGGCTMEVQSDNSTRKVLLEKYRSVILDSDVLSATLIVTPFENDKLNEYLRVLGAPYTDKRIGQISDLPEDGEGLEDRLMITFRQKTRNLVRKSLKQGFELSVSDDDWAWQFLYDIHKENISSIGGKAKPLSHFFALRKHIPNNERKLLVATLGDAPIAALLLLYFNRTVEYITPVIKHDYRSAQPLSFLIWHGMLSAIEEGYRWWNWGGTWISQGSLHHFKAGWGAIDTLYSYLINSNEEALAKIRANTKGVMDAFPYYYIFPFNRL